MSETLNRESAVPLYMQLADILRAKVESGEWKATQKIPSENELNQTYGIARMTARQVIAQLVNEGLLFRVQGKGTFVQPSKIATPPPSGYRGIRDQLERLGYPTSTRVIEVGSTNASPEVAKALDLAVGDPVMQVRRVRMVKEEPISYHCSYVPQELAPDLPRHDTGARQLCMVLAEEYGLSMGRVMESLEITIASDEEAKLLGVHRRSPLLLLQQRIHSPEGRPFELSRIVFGGNKVRLQFEYTI